MGNAILASEEGTQPSRLKREHEIRVWDWNATLAFDARGSRWGIVVNHFLTAYKIPLKFSKLHGWLWRISKYFGSHVALDLRDCTVDLLKCPELDPVYILVFVSVLLNCFDKFTNFAQITKLSHHIKTHTSDSKTSTCRISSNGVARFINLLNSQNKSLLC